MQLYAKCINVNVKHEADVQLKRFRETSLKQCISKLQYVQMFREY